MKKTVLFCLSCLLLSTCFGQKALKGLKSLDEKEYADAKETFEDALKDNPADVAGNYGLSRYFSIRRTGEQDNEKALDHLNTAMTSWKNLDPKIKGKYEKDGFTSGDLHSQYDKIVQAIFVDVKEENTIPAYEKFAGRFPGTPQETDAINRRNALAWEIASGINTVAALDDFLEKYPESFEAKGARQKRNIMAADEALKTNTVEGFKNFVEKYPDAPQAPQMRQRMNAAAWDEAKKLHTVAAYTHYIENYPNSIFLEKAKEKLRLLQEYGE